MSEDKLHIDFETRSVVDLKKFGLSVYAAHPDTDAWCMSYKFNKEPVQLWQEGEYLDSRVANHVRSGGIVIGHNVFFEWNIWNSIMRKRYGWPVLKLSQLDCTMARAYAMAFPGDLKRLAQALGIGSQKDMSGHALMMKMAKPRNIDADGNITWWDDQDRRQRLGKYCMMDTEAEAEADEKLLPLSTIERELWLLDLKINCRGIRVDNEAIDITQKFVERVKKKLDKEMRNATGNDIKKVSEAKRLLAWCKARGVEIDSLRKNDMKDLLEDPDLPYEVREVLEIRSNSAKISVAKLETMANMSLVDGRIRGMFQYHGASTGRWAGRGVQLHNLPRPEEAYEAPEFQDAIITNLTNGIIDDDYIEEWHGPFMRVISSCIRGYIVADPDKEFIGADLKNIEGVALAWLAGEEWKLEAFRQNFWHDGPGIYELTAAKILGIDIANVTKKQRQEYGKVPELALGYQGGVGAFKQMADNYGMKVDDTFAEEVRDGFRDVNSKIKNYWHNNENAAMSAVLNPGAKYLAGPKGRQVCYRIVGDYLWLQLPSGRCLCYPYPRIEKVMTHWGEEKDAVTFMGIDSRVKSATKGKWVRLSSYGGKFVENITQAVARDILAEAMPRIENAGYPIVLHVHDECVSEVPKAFGDVTEYEELMSVVPAWATGLPIAADGFRGRRYRK